MAKNKKSKNCIHILDFKKKRIKPFTNDQLCEFVNNGNLEEKERYLFVKNAKEARAVLEYVTS
tara:strand:- start:24 stop:212 length:189 start_codon:yes stop_codon:yes gene_type:complete